MVGRRWELGHKQISTSTDMGGVDIHGLWHEVEDKRWDSGIPKIDWGGGGKERNEGSPCYMQRTQLREATKCATLWFSYIPQHLCEKD